jgi:hypothetical protein
MCCMYVGHSMGMLFDALKTLQCQVGVVQAPAPFTIRLPPFNQLKLPHQIMQVMCSCC